MSCQICGKPSGYLPLCKSCFKLKDEEKVIKCPVCDKWRKTDEICPSCGNKPIRIVENTTQQESNVDPITCLICGENSNGKHFCLNCYHRYKNKEILLRINKCSFPCGEPLDESYEGVYECEDGHIVKSMAEQAIDNYLCERAIFHGYELPLDIGTQKPLKPDFCLKNYLGEGKDVYIEYFGLKGNPKYDADTAYKMKFYREKHITLICMYPKTDSKNLNFALQMKLNKEKIKENEINYEE